MAKQETKKTNKTAVKKKAAKEEPLPKRIRVTMSLANQNHSYSAGKSYAVGKGKDVEPETARSWLKSGVAMEDKAIDKTPETK